MIVRESVVLDIPGGQFCWTQLVHCPYTLKSEAFGLSAVWGSSSSWREKTFNDSGWT